MQPKLLKKLLIAVLIPTIIYPPALCAATINIDPRSGTVTVDKAQNGVPILNVAAPNSNGLSHNKLKDFNVGREGLIVNNSGNTGVSVLGGALLKNPNLNPNGGASLILNEVTGVSKSNLNGFTEIFGKKADYVLANPNGITCSGCGFINTNRTTLTTGRPEVQNGFLRNLNVEDGEISIVGDGLNAEDVDYFEIISRTAKLQGQINAKDLSIITGRNDYNYETKQITAKADNGESKPTLSIDATSLGSIYAGRIKLVSTEAGVGVNVPNDMVANTSDIVIDSKGNLTYKNLSSTDSINLKADNKIKGTGKAEAINKIGLNAQAIEITSDGKIIGHNDIDIVTDTILNAGDISTSSNLNLLGQELTNSGEISGQLTLGFNNISNSGKILTTKLLTLSGQKIDNSGEVTGYSDLNLNFDQVTNSGKIQATGRLSLSGSDFNNMGDVLSNDDVNLNFSQITNTGSTQSSNILYMTGQTLSNAGELLGGATNIKFDTITNTCQMLASDDLNITALLFSNNAEATLQSEKNINVNSGQIINEGDIQSNSQINLIADVLNNNGNILSDYVNIDGTLLNTNLIEGNTVELRGDIINKDKINGWSLLNITTNNLDNANGELMAGVLDQVNGIYTGVTSFGNLNLNYTGNLILEGKYFATGDMLLNATGNITNNTDVKSLYGLNITTSGTLSNGTAGTVMAGVFQHPDFDSDFITAGDLNIDAGTVINSGLLYSTDNLSVKSDSSILNSDVVFSWNKMLLNATSEINNAEDSYIYSYGEMDLVTGKKITGSPTEIGSTRSGAITNALGTIKTESGNINIVTGALSNESTLSGGYSKYFSLITNSGDHALGEGDLPYSYMPEDDLLGFGYMVRNSSGDLVINTGATVVKVNGTSKDVANENAISYYTTPKWSVINSGGDINIKASTVDNTSSDIVAAGNIDITASVNNLRDSVGVTLKTLSIRELTTDPNEALTFFNATRDFRNLFYGNLSSETWYNSGCVGAFCDQLKKGTYANMLIYNIGMSITSHPYTLYSSTPSSIIAGGNITINSVNKGSVYGAAKSDENGAPTYTDRKEDVNQSYSVNNSKPTLGFGINNSLNISLGSGVIKMQDISIDGMFFKYSSGPNYIIESNPLFTSVNTLMSSDYFLNKVGYNRDTFNSKFMGDAYWEKEYIAKQIESDFHKKFIVDDVTSNALQREVLMNNAMEVSGDLKLSIGVALSEAQRLALTKPIVWYVEELVASNNGTTQKVLIPKVYSPINTEFDINAGSVLSAKNIEINTDSDVNVSGIFYADNSAKVIAKDFTLYDANLRANKLNVSLSKDMAVHNSKMSVLDSASFDIAGDFNIDGKENSTGVLNRNADGSSGVTLTKTYSGSTIDIGKNLVVKANNFTMTGSNMNVGDGAAFYINGNMTLASAQESNTTENRKFESGTWSSKETTTTHSTVNQKASNLNIGGQLGITTGKDLNMVSSNINADSVFVEAKGNVNLVSALNETTDSTSVIKSGMLSKKIDETTDYKGTNIGSSIVAWNTASIKAEGDINLLASNISASSSEGNVALEANNINVVAAKDIEGHSEYHKSISYLSIGSILGSLGSFLTGGDLEFGSFKEGTKVTNKEIANASTISGTNISIKTKNDMNIVGSDISGQNIGLDIGNNLNLLSMEQAANSVSDSKEGKLYISASMSGISSVSLEGGVKYTEQKDSEKSTTNRVSTIKGGNLSIKTGNDLVSYGSNIDMTGDVGIDVGRNLLQYEVKDTLENTSETTNVRTGVRMSLTANPLQAIDGVKDILTGGFSGAKAIGALASGDISGALNNGSVGFNTGMQGVGEINQSRTRNGIDAGLGNAGKLDSVSSSGLNYFFDMNKSVSSSSSSTAIGSNINAGGNLKINVAQDMLVRGSNISANNADIDVKGNLDVQSVYDESSFNQKNISLGLSAGTGGLNGYVNASQSNADSKWVNNQSGINTTNKLNIKVGGNTNLAGSYLNSDSGDLALDTKTFTYSDMTGYDKSMTTGVGSSVGVDYVENRDGTKNYNVNAPSRTNVKFGMSDKEQVARSTVGTGNIIIGGQQVASDDSVLVGLNRDKNKSLEVTKDQKIETIDVDVDHRLFTESGRQEIVDQVKMAASTIKDQAAVVGEVLGGKADASQAGDLLAGSYNREDAIINLSKDENNKEILQALSNPDAKQEDIDKAVNLVAHELMQSYGYTETAADADAKKLVVYTYSNSNDNTNGFRERQSDSGKVLAGNEGQIGINMAQTGKSTETYYETVNHELGHAEGAVTNMNESDSETFAGSMGSVGSGAIDNGLWMADMGGLGTKETSSGTTYTFSDLMYAEDNNGMAGKVAVLNRENREETSHDAKQVRDAFSYGFASANKKQEIFDNLTFKTEKENGVPLAIATGTVFAGYGLVLATPAAIELGSAMWYSVGAGLTTALYTTGQVVNNVANKMGNAYTDLGVQAYGVQTAVQNFSTNYPKISPVVTGLAKIGWGYVTPASDISRDPAVAFGTILHLEHDYPSPVINLIRDTGKPRVVRK